MDFTLQFLRIFFLDLGYAAPLLISLLMLIAVIGYIIGWIEGWSPGDALYHAFIRATVTSDRRMAGPRCSPYCWHSPGLCSPVWLWPLHCMPLTLHSRMYTTWVGSTAGSVCKSIAAPQMLVSTAM
jgi:hypothetical protein